MPNSVLREEPALPKGRDNLFLWTVFLLFLAAMVFACWLGSFYIFGHPEQPRAYRILKRLGKVSSPVRFVVTKAPAGEFLEPQRVFERYSKYTALQMQRENELLFRNYIKNFAETKKLVPYLTGRFSVLRAYELQSGDLIGGGVVVLTRSLDFPQLLAEIIYPGPKESVPEMLGLLQSGLELRLQRTLDLSAIVQVSHALEGRLQVTVIPLLYGSYALKNGEGAFSLEPPSSLNVGAGFPVVRGEEVRSVMREHLRRQNLVKGSQQTPEESRGELVRIEGAVLAGPIGGTTGSGANPVSNSGAENGLSSVQPQGGVAAVLPEKAPSAEPSETKRMESPPAGDAVAKEGSKQRNESAPKDAPSWLAKAEKMLNMGTGGVAKNEVKSSAGSVPAQGDAMVSADKSAKSSPNQPASNAPAKPQNVSPANSLSKPQESGPLALNTAKTAPKQEPGSKTAQPVGTQSPALGVQSTEPVRVQNVKEGSPQSLASNTAATASAPLKPFVAASPAPSVTQPTGTWKTYSGSRPPSGKSVTADQATALQGRNDGAPVYLHGKFTVTAAGSNRAVLRQTSSDDGKTQARVIVEYPAGAVPPKQGSFVAKDDGRGFEIREVRRGPDGQVNIYVREVGGM